jgi:hypothetical protein
MTAAIIISSILFITFSGFAADASPKAQGYLVSLALIFCLTSLALAVQNELDKIDRKHPPRHQRR